MVQSSLARQVAQWGSGTCSYLPLLLLHTSWDQPLDKAIPELEPGFVCELAQANSVLGVALSQDVHNEHRTESALVLPSLLTETLMTSISYCSPTPAEVGGQAALSASAVDE